MFATQQYTVAKMKHLPISLSNNVRSKKGLEYKNMVLFGDYVVLSHSEGLFCAKGSETTEIVEVPGFQSAVGDMSIDTVN